MDSELIGQLRETGEHAATCDLCGRPTESTTTMISSGHSGNSDPIESRRICDSCLRLVESGDVPISPEIEDLDDRDF